MLRQAPSRPSVPLPADPEIHLFFALELETRGTPQAWRRVGADAQRDELIALNSAVDAARR